MMPVTAPVPLRQIPPPVSPRRLGRLAAGDDLAADDIESGGLFDFASNLQEALVSAGLIVLGVTMIATGAMRVFGVQKIAGTVADAVVPG